MLSKVEVRDNGHVSIFMVAKVSETLTCFGCVQSFVLFFRVSLWLTFVSKNCVKGSCQVSQDDNINESYCFRKEESQYKMF